MVGCVGSAVMDSLARAELVGRHGDWAVTTKLSAVGVMHMLCLE